MTQRGGRGLRRIGRVLRVTLGVVAVVFACGFAVWLLTRDPSAESEVERFFANEGLGEVVTVGDCRYVEADSVTDMYECQLDATEPVSLPHERGFPAGASRYCFFIPRGNRELFLDRDEDPIALGLADKTGC